MPAVKAKAMGMGWLLGNQTSEVVMYGGRM